MVPPMSVSTNENKTTRSSVDSSTPAVPQDLILDPRLCAGTLPDLAVEISGRRDTTVLARVRAISSQDFVLILPSEGGFEPGDIVSFSVFEHGVSLVADLSGVIHWVAGENGIALVALFSAEKLDQILDHRLADDRRVEIRFPTDIPVTLRSGRNQWSARITNYSLNGIGLICREPLELNQTYLATGASEDAEIRLDIDAQWLRKAASGYLIGCALEPQHGVLLAGCSSAAEGSVQRRLLAEIARGLTDDRAETLSADGSFRGADVLSSLGFDRLTLLKCCTPLLSAVLIGMSITSTAALSHITLLAGLTGIIASLVFSSLSRLRQG